MKVVLKTRDGFEKIEEVENFSPILTQVVYTYPDGVMHTHDVADITLNERTFVFDKEERIFHYKEVSIYGTDKKTRRNYCPAQ